MITHLIQENRPVQCSHVGIDTMLAELILERQGDTFADVVPRIEFDLESKRRALAIDLFVQDAIAIGIFPFRLAQQSKRLLGVKGIAVEAFIVLRAEAINWAIPDLT